MEIIYLYSDILNIKVMMKLPCNGLSPWVSDLPPGPSWKSKMSRNNPKISSTKIKLVEQSSFVCRHCRCIHKLCSQHNIYVYDNYASILWSCTNYSL